MNEDIMRSVAQKVYDENQTSDQFAVAQIGFHKHNGQDAPRIPFLYLGDVPNSYYQKAGMSVVVNSTENALEFKTLTPTSINARSYGSGVTTAVDGADTKLTLSTNSFANGVTWDATNSKFVIQTAGQYIIIAQVAYQNTVAGKVYRAGVALNGNTNYFVYSCSSSSGTSTLFTTVSDIQTLSVGDTLELYTFHNSGVDKTILTASNQTFLSISKV